MAKDTTGAGPCFAIEDLLAARIGCRRVAGVDEAGRGPLAGPVVAACVLLDRGAVPEGLDDSKRLKPARRAELFAAIVASAEVGVGIASVAEIDRLNILRANDLAMHRAVAALSRGVSGLVIDGNRVPPGTAHPAEAVVGGDGLALGVAAASIVAKVTRDRIMTRLDRAFPAYGWRTNFGYATASHRAALRQHGRSPHHRRSFRCEIGSMCEESHRTG
ncbi:MAG TPA: ribonuclease HII [Thermohalobaculum sp.]|nr:ribonuclease HII [Thermohalobaculum sp.]